MKKYADKDRNRRCTALWGTLWREILFDFWQKSNKIHGRSLSVKFCSEANSENTDSKASLLANTLASSSKQAAQAKAKGLRSLLCAIIPPFRRVFLHPRPNGGREPRFKAVWATVRVNYPPFPPELSAVRIIDRVSGTRARIPLPSGSTPCASFRAKSHKVSCKMPFYVVLHYTFSAYRA